MESQKDYYKWTLTKKTNKTFIMNRLVLVYADSSFLFPSPPLFSGGGFCTQRQFHPWSLVFRGELLCHYKNEASGLAPISQKPRLFSTVHQYTIASCCDGVHGVLYTRGGKRHPSRSRGCHFPPFCTPEGEKVPRGCTKPMDPKHSATIVLLYLSNINVPLLEFLLLSSNIITMEYSLFNKQTNKKQFLTVPSNPQVFRTQRWKSINTGNGQGDVHRCTSLFMLPDPKPCNMRFCCTSRDWFSTNQTSRFVTVC